MARIYQEVCTIHLAQDEIVTIPGDELFGFNGDWWTFGVCKECRDTISVAEFETLVNEHGVKMKDGELPPGMKVKKPKAATAPATARDDGEPCLYCKFVSKTEGALNQHLRSIHNFKGVKDSYGTTCPLDGTRQGILGQHTKGAHGLTLARAFMKARDEGDTHGVVAAALERKGAA